MGLFHRWRKPPPADWIAGTATILFSTPRDEPSSRENSGDSIIGLELNHFGYRPYDFRLEVTNQVHGTYETEGFFKVPRRAENTGWLAHKVQVGLKPGLKLPVKVDPRDRDRLQVDWPAFLAAPNRKREQEDADLRATQRKMQEMQEADPKLQALVREDRPADD